MKCILDLNLRAEIKKLLEEVVGENICEDLLKKDFLGDKNMNHKWKMWQIGLYPISNVCFLRHC